MIEKTAHSSNKESYIKPDLDTDPIRHYFYKPHTMLNCYWTVYTRAAVKLKFLAAILNRECPYDVLEDEELDFIKYITNDDFTLCDLCTLEGEETHFLNRVSKDEHSELYCLIIHSIDRVSKDEH